MTSQQIQKNKEFSRMKRNGWMITWFNYPVNWTNYFHKFINDFSAVYAIGIDDK